MQEFDKGPAKTILTSMVFALDALFSLFTLLIFIDTIKNLVPSTIIAFVALLSHVCFIPSVIIYFEEGKGIFVEKDKKENEGKMYVVEKEIKLENGEILNVGKIVLAKPNGEIKYTNKDGKDAFAVVPLNHLKKYRA